MATDTWSIAGSGNWSVGADWSRIQPPGAADIALLAGPGPYTVTVDVSALAAGVILGASQVTLAIASTLGVSGSVTVAASADVDLSGQFSAGVLDLSGGGRLTADGGALYGTALLGLTTTIDGAGTITNDGSIGWSAAGPGNIAINSAGFDNVGQLVLTPGTETLSNAFVVGVNVVPRHQPTPITATLMWLQTDTANITLGAADNFANSGLLQMQGGTLTVTGGNFANSGTVSLLGASTQSVVATGVIANITTYGVVTSLIPGNLTVGAGVASFVNTGTIAATSIEFQGAMSLASLGAVTGALTFDAGLDLGGGTLLAGTVSVGGLVQNGTIGGTGTLVLQAGATLDNVSLGAGLTIIEPSSGSVTIMDPPATSAVTLDAAINRLTFSNAGSFDGNIVLGAGASASNDIIAVNVAGGLTLGPDFSLTSSASGLGVTFANPAGSVVNQGTWTLSGASVTVLTAFVGNGTVNLNAGANVEVANLDGAGLFALSKGAILQVDTLAPTAAPAVAFGAGPGTLILPGTGTIGVVLSGLAVGDVIDFASVSSGPNALGVFATPAAGVVGASLSLVGASGDTASVALGQTINGLSFIPAPDAHGGTQIQIQAACFLEGTRITTPAGEVPVETLRPGDAVLTASGRVAPVRWVGCTRLDLARHPQPARVAPLRIRAGAFGPGRPRRDLFVSPEHCLPVGGVLIPAGRLADGVCIAREDGFRAVTYWHVELDRHDLLLAEGLPAESYLDTGNRAVFAGEQGARPLHADFAADPPQWAQAIWEALGCAKLCLEGPRLHGARTALQRRAAALGCFRTDDAGLTLRADGTALAWSATPDGITARITARTRKIRLLSRNFVPSERDLASGDTRRLGVAVAGAWLDGAAIPPACFNEGWHAPDGGAWRWTNGDAVITLPTRAASSTLRLRLLPLGAYWVAPACLSPVASAPRSRAGRRLRR